MQRIRQKPVSKCAILRTVSVLKSGIASRKKPEEPQSKPVIGLVNFSCHKHKPDTYIINKEKCGLGLLYFFKRFKRYLQSLCTNGKVQGVHG